jgi:hypothetical protein
MTSALKGDRLLPRACDKKVALEISGAAGSVSPHASALTVMREVGQHKIAWVTGNTQGSYCVARCRASEQKHKASLPVVLP